MAAEDRSLQDLFASLRSNSSAPRPQMQQSFSSQQSFSAQPQQRPGSENMAFSPLGTQSRGQNMAGTSPGASQNSMHSQQTNQDRTASLLNLLKFDKNGAAQSPHPQSPGGNVRASSYTSQPPASSSSAQNLHGRGVSASDLVASFMGKPAAASPARASASPAPIAEPAPVSSANPQDYLLQLLNRSSNSPAPRAQANAAQNIGSPSTSAGIPPPIVTDSPQLVQTPGNRQSEGRNSGKSTPIRVFGSVESRETTPFEPTEVPAAQNKAPQPAKPIFTYVNPFEQLSASSPRNQSGANTPQRVQPQSTNVENGKKIRLSMRSPAANSPAHRQESFNQDHLTPNGSEILKSVESPDPPALDDGRSKLEALIGIGAPTNDTETVAQALNNVGEQVSQQADNALAAAEAEPKTAKEQKEFEQAVDNQLQKVASEVKQELDEPENKGVLEEVFDEETAKDVKEVLEDAAEGQIGAHGSADDEKSSGNAEDDYSVPVYNFPMKPFATIELTQPKESTVQFREHVITDIARLKKEFDQIDRTLATASGEYIMYAMPKPGGFRVIRQEDGADRQVFKETKDHVFNVALSTAPRGKNTHDLQSCLATAVSGTVYWLALYHKEDHIKAQDINEHTLLFPPVSAHEEHTSGGQLKTRAKRSSRHPEIFAIGRGKSIQIVFPLHAATSEHVNANKVVNTEAYFKDRSLKINTGKAGKDFIFSEDDTVIATLDKAGRLRFWDIRELVHETNGMPNSRIEPTNIQTPLLTFPTSMANEKSWPTSVLFVDKLRAYAKGVAQRYVLVGLKQNHTLQLWDLGIGKVIQEVYFPHTKESDAICSVAYHPGSGIIVVGHPTRNSIYFIHLSAPKYNLTGMSQARYLTRLVDKDPTLPKPEATAIMSGMREISFAAKGQLRSLDLLPMSNDSTVIKEEPGLFELYVMHSKGVTCLSIQKSDLGWTEESKVIDARDAEKLGIIKIKDLVQPPPAIVSESSSVNGDPMPRQASAPMQNSKKAPTTATAEAVESVLQGIVDDDATGASSRSVQNGGEVKEKSEKKKKKKSAAPSIAPESSFIPPPAPSAPPPSYANAAATKSPTPAPVELPSGSREKPRISKRRTSPARSSLSDADSITMGISSEFIDKELRKIETTVSTQFTKSLNKELETLYTRFMEDKRVLQAQGSAQQEAILRLVSSSLGDNVEKSLGKIVSNSIKDHVVPAINQITATTLQKELPSFLSSNINKSLPGTVKQALTETVHTTMQKPDVLRVLSNEVSAKVSQQVEKQFEELFNGHVIPTFKDLTLTAASKIATETEQRVSQQLDRANLKHDEDNAKIEQLTNVVRTLSETVHSMAAAQSDFQKEILKLHELQSQVASSKMGQNDEALDTIASQRIQTPEVPMTPEMRELEEVRQTMSEGKFEEGTIMWLQSSDQAGIFDRLFVNAQPEYLQHCSPLVTLSVAAAVTSSLETNIAERLYWLDVILSTIDAKDPDVREVAPKIMEVLCQRLEARYMEIAEIDHMNPVLRSFSPLKKKAREIVSLSRA